MFFKNKCAVFKRAIWYKASLVSVLRNSKFVNFITYVITVTDLSDIHYACPCNY